MKIERQLSRFFINFLIILMFFFAVVSVIQGVRNAIGSVHGSFDFQYDSAILFRERINPYDESLNPTGIAQNMGLFEYYDKVEANQFPSLLAILLPYTFLPPHMANIAWALTNLLMTSVIIALSRKLFFIESDKQVFILLVLCLLSGTGWRNNIGNGQHTIFAFAFFLISLWLSECKRPILSGITLAVSYLKYTLTIPLALYFIFKKKYKELVISVAIHVVATPLCALWLNDSVVNMIRKPLEVSGALSSSGYIDFSSVINMAPGMSMALAVLMCGFMFVLALIGSRRNGSIYYSILSYISLIVIYHRLYDFFILFIPVGLFLGLWQKESDSSKRRVYLIDAIVSAGIFVYGNFVQKVIDVLMNRVPLIQSLNPHLTFLYAIVVYVFVVWLIIQYMQNKSENKMGRKETVKL